MTWSVAGERLPAVMVGPGLPIREATRRLDLAGTGALLVCSPDGVLLGLLSDGDIRRAMLRGVDFAAEIGHVMTRTPLVAGPDVSRHDALRMMDHGLAFPVNQLPLADAHGLALGLLLRRDLVVAEELPLAALIMAGGFGQRMLPLTEQIPKPMLPVADRPLLAWTLQRLRDAGIGRAAISTHHLADRIRDHFGDGVAHGVALTYVHEDAPLGTAGALRLLPTDPRPLLVVNGDILTGVPFADMLAYHRQHGAELTVGMRQCELTLPYGVMECSGPRIRSVREKPSQTFWVNAGIYIVEPAARALIPAGTQYDMTDLMDRMLAEDRPVVGFPIVEYWLDIGQPDDYIRAQMDAALQEAAS